MARSVGKASKKRATPVRTGVKKVSVSLAADDLAWANAEARTHRLSLSAVLTDALRRRRRSELLGKLLTDLGADHISEADMNVLRAELYGLD